MAECKFHLRLTIVGLLLVALGTLEYAIATTASNVALGKLGTQTDTAGGADPSLAVDGDTTTCAKTGSHGAEWTLDLKGHYVIKEVSIHTETVSQWVTSIVACPEPEGDNQGLVGPDDGLYPLITWIEVEFAKQVIASKVDIYEEINHARSFVRVKQITCYVDNGWETVWSATSTAFDDGKRIFAADLTKSCFSNRIRLDVLDTTEGRAMHIDAVKLHGRLSESFKIEIGLTSGMYEAEENMTQSTTSPATWSPSNKGPHRYVRKQTNPQDETLKLCEVQVKGYLQPRTPYFQVAAGIAMSNPAVSTVFNVASNIVCAYICLRQTELACVTAQFEQATQSYALFDIFEHTKNPSNENKTVVFEFAAQAFANEH